MKSFPFLPVCLRASLVLVCLGFLAGAHGADAKPNAKPSSTTNAVPLEVPFPQAVFEYGGKAVKDPFFPLSTRTPHLAAQPVTELAITPSTFKLKGLSGTLDNPLALINNRTVTTGERTEVTTATGKYKIHCLEIKKISVVIRVEGQFEPIELFLPKGDR